MINIELWNKRKKELGWTLDDIAEKSGISRRTVARVFSGNPKYPDPTYNTVQAIERALGLSKEPEWTDEEKAQGVGSHSVKLSADEWEWLELRSELLEAGGQEYLDTITTLLQKSAEISKKKK